MNRFTILAISLLLMLALCACGASGDDGSTANAETSSQVVEETVNQAPFYEDEIVKATFLSAGNLPGMEGMGAVNVTFENLSDEKITVYPKDSSVNDMMVQFGSGLPATMESGKSMNYVWTFSLEAAGLADGSEIKTIELKLWVVDDNTDTLVETEPLTIEVGK